MPIDNPEATADATSRRAFIARSAIGAAVVGSGVLAGFGQFLPAGAQTDEPTGDDGPTGGAELDDDAVGRFLAPLELGAVQAYQRAIDSGQVNGFEEEARRYRAHHSEAAGLLSALIVDGSDDEPVGPDEIVASTGAGGLNALAEMEAVLAATHIVAIEQMTDPVTALQSARISAAQSQQAAALFLAGGGEAVTATPAEVDLSGARQPGVMPTTPDDAGPDDTDTDTDNAGTETTDTATDGDTTSPTDN